MPQKTGKGVDIIIPHAYGAIGTRTILNRWSKDKGVVTLGRKLFILLLSGVFLVGQWGCVTARYEYPKPEPLLEKYREQLGTIGITIDQDFPAFQYDGTLPKNPGVLVRMGQGTVEGAENSWDWWVDLCSGEIWKKEHVEKRMVAAAIGGIAIYVVPLVFIGVCYILTPPVALFGGIGGFFYGALPPDESVAYPAADEATLQYTVANYPIQENFQSAFLKEARARTSHMFVVVPEEGAQTDEGMVGQGVDTVLELSVQRIWLKRVDDREGEMNPPMVFVLFVRARLMRGPEKTVWYDQTFVHETKKRPYKEWPYHYNFQTDIEKAYQNLAKQMVNELFFKTQASQQS